MPAFQNHQRWRNSTLIHSLPLHQRISSFTALFFVFPDGHLHTYISSCTINYTLGLINGILWIAIICLYIFKENFVSQRRLLWFICQYNHLQDSRALRADEGTDGHVDVRRPPLSTIKAFSVSRKWTQLPQDLQVTIVLLFPHCCCHPGLGIDDVCWWWCGGIRFEVVARASTALNAPEEFLSIFFVN